MLDELVNIESQSMDIIEYSTASTSILEQERVVDCDGDFENSELCSASQIGENSTSASESESIFYSSDEEKEIAATEVSDQDVSEQLYNSKAISNLCLCSKCILCNLSDCFVTHQSGMTESLVCSFN